MKLRILKLFRDFILILPYTRRLSMTVDILTEQIEGLGRRAEKPGDPGRACPLHTPGNQREGYEKRTVGTRP